MDVASLGFQIDLMIRRLAGSVIVDRREYLVVRTPANPGFGPPARLRSGQLWAHRARCRALVIVADPGDVAIRIYRSLGFADFERQVQLQREPQPDGPRSRDSRT